MTTVETARFIHYVGQVFHESKRQETKAAEPGKAFQYPHNLHAGRPMDQSTVRPFPYLATGEVKLATICRALFGEAEVEQDL